MLCNRLGTQMGIAIVIVGRRLGIAIGGHKAQLRV